MKFKYIFTSLLGTALLLSGCMDKFADINTDPSIVNGGDIRYKLTKLEDNFRPLDYWAWYHDYTNMARWGQITVSSGGNSEKMNETDAASGGDNNIKNLISSYRDIQHTIEVLSAEEGARYKHIEAMATTLMVYTVLQNTDMYGSRVFSEMGLARYGGPTVPKYDSQEKLFDNFITDLKEAADILAKPTFNYNGTEVVQANMDKQDLFANGDAAKWAKLANSLRLKVATRLYNADQARAFELVKDIVNHPAGLILTNEDNMMNYKGIKYYGPNENPGPGTANKTLIDFLKENRDPRLRFMFTKNSYNSKVVQAYFDAKHSNENEEELPSYILDKVEFEVDADGKKVFKGWKAPGEPWVRYHGLPSEIEAQNKEEWKEYFDAGDKISKITIKVGDKEFSKTYGLMSGLQMQHYKNNNTLSYPDAPTVTVTPDTDPRILYSYIMTAGEVNLYLAEFKTLGAEVSGTAQDYFTAGIRTSVEAWDELSKLNKVRYYDVKYDENEETIKLKPGEIDALLQRDAYKLNGDDKDLEKIYLQQRFNFILNPQEMYVTMRRSGFPKFNSEIYSFENFNPGDDYLLPRRFAFRDPAESDKMRNNILEMLEEQGFTIGFTPAQLNGQRVWYDKNAPQFGMGM